MRQARLGGLWVRKHAGLIGPLVDRRTTDLGEPNRFRLWNPGRCDRKFYSVDTFMVGLRPEIPQILLPKDPGLAEPVGDCGSPLRIPGGIVDVKPVIALTTRKIIGKIFHTMRTIGQGAVELVGTIAPIRQGRVVVDADDVDRRRCPQSIERKTR